jgi:hypothetical protein
MKFSASVKIESFLRLNTKVEDYEILHMLTKIWKFSTLGPRDMNLFLGAIDVQILEVST